MHPKPVRPPRLRPGSRVALVTPSGPLLERDHAARGVELCHALGYRPLLLPHAGRVHGYLGGTGDERLADLNTALADPSIDAVWCLRGGNGMNRIVDRVAFDDFAAHPKPVIGYSDITVLLSALVARTGVVTFHGPMARFALPEFSRRHFDAVLGVTAPAGQLGRLATGPAVLVPERGRIVPVIAGRASGPLVGGNLTLLQSLIGTPWLPNLDGAILFLEDIGEDLYRIDRMLGHFRLAGLLGGLAGVAIGHFSRLRRATSEGAFGLDDVLRNYFEPHHIPVAHGFPIGHVSEQWTLPIGVRAELDTAAGELTLLEGAVS
jgi:muramoyltetrapeptide carboxypeptidase